jgi:hypothetical protein
MVGERRAVREVADGSRIPPAGRRWRRTGIGPFSRRVSAGSTGLFDPLEHGGF